MNRPPPYHNTFSVSPPEMQPWQDRYSTAPSAPPLPLHSYYPSPAPLVTSCQPKARTASSCCDIFSACYDEDTPDDCKIETQLDCCWLRFLFSFQY